MASGSPSEDVGASPAVETRAAVPATQNPHNYARIATTGRICAWFPCHNGLTRGWGGSMLPTMEAIRRMCTYYNIHLSGFMWDHPFQKWPAQGMLRFDQYVLCSRTSNYDQRALTSPIAFKTIYNRIVAAWLNAFNECRTAMYVGPWSEELTAGDGALLAQSLLPFLLLNSPRPSLVVDGSAEHELTASMVVLLRSVFDQPCVLEAAPSISSALNRTDLPVFMTYVAAAAVEYSGRKNPVYGILWRDASSERAYVSKNTDGSWNRGAPIPLSTAYSLAQQRNAHLYINLDPYGMNHTDLVALAEQQARFNNWPIPPVPPVPDYTTWFNVAAAAPSRDEVNRLQSPHGAT